MRFSLQHNGEEKHSFDALEEAFQKKKEEIDRPLPGRMPPHPHLLWKVIDMETGEEVFEEV